MFQEEIAQTTAKLEELKLKAAQSEAEQRQKLQSIICSPSQIGELSFHNNAYVSFDKKLVEGLIYEEHGNAYFSFEINKDKIKDSWVKVLKTNGCWLCYEPDKVYPRGINGKNWDVSYWTPDEIVIIESHLKTLKFKSDDFPAGTIFRLDNDSGKWRLTSGFGYAITGTIMNIIIDDSQVFAMMKIAAIDF